MMRRFGLHLAILLALSGLTCPCQVLAESPQWMPEHNLRRPTAIAVTHKWLYVANRNSGTISVIDRESTTLVAEIEVGRQLADLTVTADEQTILVVDEAESQLIELTNAGPDSEVRSRIATSPSPVSVAVSADGRVCSVAALWSRQINLFDRRLSPADTSDADPEGNAQRAHWVVRSTIDLTIAPRLQYLDREGRRLVVADSFGGRLALIDVDSAELVAYRTIQGHNIRGLAPNLSGERLLIAHQMLNGRMPTDHQRVFWGDVMGNLLRTVELQHLWDVSETDKGESSELQVDHWTIYPLGHPGNAAGDPGAIVTGIDGWTLVVGSGTHEIAVRQGDLQVFTRHAVGHRPVDVGLSPDQRFAYIANMFDDSISVFELASREVVKTISLGPQLPLGTAEIGEQMFYDARLSLDGWYSCHSCHTDGHTCGLVNDNLGDRSYGAPKNIPTLLGTRVTGPWGWDGHQSNLQEQIRRSITLTMQGDPANCATEHHIQAIDAFLWKLTPPPSLAKMRQREEVDAVQRGGAIFSQQKCWTCHWRGTFTSNTVYDVGLQDENDRKEFNPPSLHGLSQRETFFHDGRAKELRDVLMTSEHGAPFELSEKDYRDLAAYLLSL